MDNNDESPEVSCTRCWEEEPAVEIDDGEIEEEEEDNEAEDSASVD